MPLIELRSVKLLICAPDLRTEMHLQHSEGKGLFISSSRIQGEDKTVI